MLAQSQFWTALWAELHWRLDNREFLRWVSKNLEVFLFWFLTHDVLKSCWGSTEKTEATITTWLFDVHQLYVGFQVYSTLCSISTLFNFMQDDSTISIFPQVFRAILRNSPTLIITASLNISGNLSCVDLCAGKRLTFLKIKKVSVNVWNPRRNTDIYKIDGLEWCSWSSSGRVIQLYPFDFQQRSRVKTRGKLSYWFPDMGVPRLLQ